ncbi:MAG TPA: glycosyl hydrolase [Acetobacteraceae bacterium]|nr:glycosyl hydrolase [Acetobacteraceae bacterium]
MAAAPLIAPADLEGLKWRCIGPTRGGRVVAVAGDAQNPMVGYFGACAGGVWKTIDGGQYWRNVSDGFFKTSSVGALAVARSDSNVIYAGMGETTIRLDVSYGDGVYKSTDAGRSWAHMGLAETKHIGRVLIHPDNPDLVYIAALGDIFGPNDQRGVYRSEDGGASWQRVLFKSDRAGAVDIAMDAENPRILFASIWQTRRSFWNISSGGPDCGLYRSMDGGDTWEEITTAPGLPDGLLGKIGVAVSPVRAGRVWALVEAQQEKSGLYRSDDYGASWLLTSNNRDLMHRPWYYTHVYADTGHEGTVYVTNLGMWKSTDGGVSFTEINTGHGDNHDVWIDPHDPLHMIEGNDGGCGVSYNGGITWSSIYNQMTAQLYRIDIDNEFPYRVYGTQQDNTSVAVPSASHWGAIPLLDCHYPGTGESGFIVVDPRDSNIVYCGAVGSSPGGAGALQRYDHRTRQIQLINVWPEQNTGVAPRDLKYRFAWTYPIAFSPHDPGTLYVGGNHVFRTRDEGMNWEPISPDLSLNDKSRQDHSGGQVTRESAGAEVHATCASVVENPHRQGEIWASTDDGLVHVTRDNGANWTNVTPPGMPELAYVGCVEISPHDADTVYLTATRYKLSDYRPYLFRSTDGGKTWASVNGDLPQDEITRVLRVDPVAKNLLFVGTETGLYHSTDAGAHWLRMGGGLPVTPVYDIKLKGADLVVGTHGRSFWILDDISPLREIAAGKSGTRLVAPRQTIRMRLHHAALGNVKGPVSFGLTFGVGGGIAVIDMPDGSKRREHLDVGENPPNGAILYYWLDTTAPVSLTIRDAAGAEVVRFAADDPAPARRPPGKQGLNRFIWDLKRPGPTNLDPALAPVKQKPLSKEPDPPAGALVVPGRYTVELNAGDSTSSAPLDVVKDPRVTTTPEAFAAQAALLAELASTIGELNETVNRIRRMKRQVAALRDRAPEMAARCTTVEASLAQIETTLVDTKRQSARDTLRNPAGLADTLSSLTQLVSIGDSAPTSQARGVTADITGKVKAQFAALDALIAGEIAGLNQSAGGVAAVTG